MNLNDIFISFTKHLNFYGHFSFFYIILFLIFFKCNTFLFRTTLSRNEKKNKLQQKKHKKNNYFMYK